MGRGFRPAGKQQQFSGRPQAPQILQKRQADLRIPDIDGYADNVSIFFDQAEQDILIPVIYGIFSYVDLRKCRCGTAVRGGFPLRTGIRAPAQRVNGRVGMDVTGIDGGQQDFLLLRKLCT